MQDKKAFSFIVFRVFRFVLPSLLDGLWFLIDFAYEYNTRTQAEITNEAKLSMNV